MFLTYPNGQRVRRRIRRRITTHKTNKDWVPDTKSKVSHRKGKLFWIFPTVVWTFKSLSLYTSLVSNTQSNDGHACLALMCESRALICKRWPVFLNLSHLVWTFKSPSLYSVEHSKQSRSGLLGANVREVTASIEIDAIWLSHYFHNRSCPQENSLEDTTHQKDIRKWPPRLWGTNSYLRISAMSSAGPVPSWYWILSTPRRPWNEQISKASCITSEKRGALD
jgi:hypothetical protein